LTTGEPGPLGAWYARRRYGVLFYTLLLTLAAGPLLTTFGLGADLLQILLGFSLLVALLGVPGQRWRVLLMLLAAVAVALRLTPPSAVGADVVTTARLVETALALVAAVLAVRFSLRARTVDAEHIYAALCAYLLAGLFFGALYWTIERAWPGSLSDPAAAAFPLSSAIYFSFVTLATLGYGDVLPRTELARGLAMLEAIGGQLYVAVMIARLVGAQLQGGGPRGTAGNTR
jgi:voltage-gated potassium channel